MTGVSVAVNGYGVIAKRLAVESPSPSGPDAPPLSSPELRAGGSSRRPLASQAIMPPSSSTTSS